MSVTFEGLRMDPEQVKQVAEEKTAPYGWIFGLAKDWLAMYAALETWEKERAQVAAAEKRAEEAERKLDAVSDALSTYSEFYDRCCEVIGIPNALPSSEMDNLILSKLAAAQPLAQQGRALREAVVDLLEYRQRAGALGFQLEKADDYFATLEALIYAPPAADDPARDRE